MTRGQPPSRGRFGRVVALAALAACFAPAGAHASWDDRVERAADWARERQGVVYFAVTGQRGRLHGRRAHRVAPSASVLKAMLLVAYLRRVRDRPLTDYDRSLLAPMIRRSANEPANRIIGIVGRKGVNRVARRAGMRRFVLHLPIWGHSEITCRDQARFFREIDSYLPEWHRRYGMWLLASIVPSQRWGIPEVLPDGWRINFKGGWGSGTGRVTHQVALLRRGDTRISLAVLTQWNPSQAYGERTIRGVAWRLLRGL
jgi:Beta-lactamase enzyme family